MILRLIAIFLGITAAAYGQSEWQQWGHTTITARLFPEQRLLLGIERLVYYNNSPDTLRELHFNLYVNAFRKNSAMHRYQVGRYGQSAMDFFPEGLLGGLWVTIARDGEGNTLAIQTDDTFLKIPLARPVLPGDSTVVEMDFAVQIPYLIRRMGWHSREGVEFTMGQWYPRICVYDRDGWHRLPYLGREFYGEFGRFDVALTLPFEYKVAATGTRGDPDAATFYMPTTVLDLWQEQLKINDSSQTAMHYFRADSVHDFAWSADRRYVHDVVEHDGIRIHFYYLPNVAAKWDKAGGYAKYIVDYLNRHVGRYPYPDLTIAQAGDGGMEYPTITFITGDRGAFSLASVMAHEIGHNWFQGMLANNEIRDPWFDEGLVSYYTTRIMEDMFGPYAMTEYDSPFKNRHYPKDDAFVKTMTGYRWWAKQGYEQPAATHADSFVTDEALTYGTYYKGQIFMLAMEYLVGQDRLDRLMREFFAEYQFRHVSMDDMREFFERRLDTDLRPFFDAWLKTTDLCDYSVSNRGGQWRAHGGKRFYEQRIRIQRHGDVRMPVDVYVRMRSGQWRAFRIPLDVRDPSKPGLTMLDPWTQDGRSHTITVMLDDAVERIEIDTTRRLPDVDRLNNRTGFFPKTKFYLQTPVARSPALDAYTVEHRPSLWYNAVDRARVGWKWRGQVDPNEYRLNGGVYYGVDSRQPDFDLHYSTPVYSWGKQTTVEFSGYRLEGRSSALVGVRKRWYGTSFRSAPITDAGISVRWENVYDTDYFPRGIFWSGENRTTIQATFRRQLRIQRSPVLDAGISLPVTGAKFVRSSLQIRYPVAKPVSWLDPSVRIFLGASVGDVPVEDRFYLSGASPRGMFDNRLYRSRGTVPAWLWHREKTGQRHWHMDGDGGLSGYAAANASARSIAAINGTIGMDNPIKAISSVNLGPLTEAAPFGFAESAIFDERWFADVGVGARYRLPLIPVWAGIYTLRFEAPLWVSNPSFNGDSKSGFSWRWVVGLEIE